jgi:hypothetical protein
VDIWMTPRLNVWDCGVGSTGSSPLFQWNADEYDAIRRRQDTRVEMSAQLAIDDDNDGRGACLGGGLGLHFETQAL